MWSYGQSKIIKIFLLWRRESKLRANTYLHKNIYVKYYKTVCMAIRAFIPGLPFPGISDVFWFRIPGNSLNENDRIYKPKLHNYLQRRHSEYFPHHKSWSGTTDCCFRMSLTQLVHGMVGLPWAHGARLLFRPHVEACARSQLHASETVLL